MAEQPPLSKIIQALEHPEPAIRIKGINALIRSKEVEPENIIETLNELKQTDNNAEVRELAEQRVTQYRQYYQQHLDRQEASKSVPPEPATTKKQSQSLPPVSASGGISAQVFILNPKNLDYLNGKAKQPEAKSQWGSLIWQLLSFVLFLSMAIYGGYSLKKHADWEALPIKGKVNEVYIVEGGYRAFYEYTTPDGRLQQGTYEFTNVLENVYIGEEIRVEMVNNTPIAHFAPGDKRYNTGMAIMGGFFTVLMPIWMFITMGKMERQKVLLEKGALMDGVLTSAELSTPKFRGGLGCLGILLLGIWRAINPKHILTIRFRLTSPDSGKSLTGEAEYQRNDLKGKRIPSENTPVKILYLNDKNYMVL